jgi:transcriptional regulator with XRE-family HTH domain
MKFVNINVLYGEKLRNLRLKYDVKQFVVADALGITQQGISKLELGYITFSDEMIKTICEFFNITRTSFEINLETIEFEAAKHEIYDTIIDESARDFLLKSVLKELKKNRIERDKLRKYLNYIESNILPFMPNKNNSGFEID